jgi:ATP-dependent Clp protease, protease subunit
MRPCFAFSNIEAADNKPAVLSIYEDIGFWGTQAGEFIAQLGQVQGTEVHVEINSPGGDVFAALAMYNALRASGKKIVAKVMGVAASAASLVFMAGDERVMPKNTHLMVHNPWTIALGNAAELRDQADTLDKIGDSLVATYVARSGMSEEDVRAMLSKDTWLNADESKEKGLATEVVDEIKATAKFDMDRADLPEAVRAVFAATKPAVQPPAKTEPQASVTPPAPPAKPFAEQVTALAAAAGMQDYVATWLVKHTTTEQVVASIGEAREIVAYCAALGKPDKAPEFIKAGKTFVEARTEMTNAAAEGDQHIDTAPRNKGATTSNSPNAVTTADIWAAHRKQRGV